MTTASRKPDNLLELIGQAYDAAQDENLWPALLPQTAQTFDSTSAVLLTQDVATGKPKVLTYTENYDARSIDQYENYYYERDIWRERVLSKEIRGVFTSADLIMDAEFERSEFYNDYPSKRDNTFYVLGAFLPVTDDQAGRRGASSSSQIRLLQRRGTTTRDRVPAALASRAANPSKAD
jgi:hypothetical protein